MTIQQIEHEFRAKVAGSIRIVSEGLDRFRVFTPFVLDDGDHLSIVLKQQEGHWFLSDEGNSLMRLTYDVSEKALHKGKRQNIIANVKSIFGLEDQNGELVLRVREGRYGDSLYSFAQALLQILDLNYLNRIRERSQFMAEFRELIVETVPEDRRVFDWTNPDYDPAANYPVDCRIETHERPLFVHALSNDSRTSRATIVLLRFEQWRAPFQALGIFEDQERIDRRVLARYTDVCDRMFSSLGSNQSRIIEFVKGVVGAEGNGSLR